MEKIGAFASFVNDQRAFHERQALRFSDDYRRKELHSSTADKFKSLAEYIENLEKTVAEGTSLPRDQYRLALTQDELKNLPAELMGELSVSDADRADFNIVDLINNAGGVATLDRILVALYRQSGEIMKRQNLNARLYRMGQKGLVYSIQGKKGVYATKSLSEEDIAKLI